MSNDDLRYRSVFRDGLFTGQAIIVTGAGSGIGRCVAHELASLGARIALVGRTKSKLEDVADEIAKTGGFASIHVCDIRSEEAVIAMVDAVLAQHGRIDGLVNNAGGQFPSNVENISLNGWNAVIATNLTGGFLVSRECYRRWMKDNSGTIVNIVADFWGSWPLNAHSGAARAGMVSFTETAALEWAANGVRVNAVAPGWVESSGLDHYPPERLNYIRSLYRGVPLARLASEAEISAAIVFLLSEASAFITGTVIRVDGGRPQARLGVTLSDKPATKVFDGFHLAKKPKALALGAD